METCPGCSKSFASVHMRQYSEELRLCAACVVRTKWRTKSERKKQRSEVKSSGVAHDRKVSILLIALGMTAAGYLTCVLWDPYGSGGDKMRARPAPQREGSGSLSARAEPTPEEQPNEQPVLSTTPMPAPLPEIPRTTPLPRAYVPPTPAPRVITLNLQGDVLFEFGRTDLKEGATEPMERLVDVVRQYRAAKITVRGYTDAVGSEKANLTLSLQRAETVRDWIARRADMPAEAIAVEGVGSRDPVAPNLTPEGADNPAGRAQNRRVTVTLSGRLIVAGER